MQLELRRLFTTSSGLEYSAISSGGGELISVQGDHAVEGRLKQVWRCGNLMYRADPEHALKPLSLGMKDGVVSAVFEGELGGMLEDFLKQAPKTLQYAVGRRTGQCLKALHTADPAEAVLKKAAARQSGFMERIAAYVGGGVRFPREQAGMQALSLRFDHFTGFRPGRRMGILRSERVMVRSDLAVLCLPHSSMIAADVTEDFALMECSLAAGYPVFCAGVIDGYFHGLSVPPEFWLNFALQCALYSLWHCAREVKRDPALKARMRRESERIAADFADFRRPIPHWYGLSEVRRARSQCLKQAL